MFCKYFLQKIQIFLEECFSEVLKNFGMPIQWHNWRGAMGAIELTSRKKLLLLYECKNEFTVDYFYLELARDQDRESYG